MSDQNESNQSGTHENPTGTNPSYAGADVDLEAQQDFVNSMRGIFTSLKDRILGGDTALADRVAEIHGSLDAAAQRESEGSNTAGAATGADSNTGADVDNPFIRPSSFHIASMEAISRLYDPSNPLTFEILTMMDNPIQQATYAALLSFCSWAISQNADRSRDMLVRSVLERESDAQPAALSSTDTSAEASLQRHGRGQRRALHVMPSSGNTELGAIVPSTDVDRIHFDDDEREGAMSAVCRDMIESCMRGSPSCCSSREITPHRRLHSALDHPYRHPTDASVDPDRAVQPADGKVRGNVAY
jgi:hypothetical protein